MSTMIHYSILDEDTLIDLLQIDKKQFRSAIYCLRNDHLLKQITRKEKSPQAGSTVTYVFYYIHYYSFLNAVYFRINRIRKDIVSQDKGMVNAAVFQCKYCQKNFYDIDIPTIFNFETNEMTCNVCGGEVIELKADQPARSNKCLIAKFNEQIEPFLKMIQDCMGYTIHPRRLEPEIMEEHIKRAEFARNNPNKAGDYIRKQYLTLGHSVKPIITSDQKINISFTEKEKFEEKVQKPYPSWLLSNPSTTSVEQTKSPLEPTTSNPRVLSDIIAHESHDKNKDVLSLSETDSLDEAMDMNENSDFNGDFDVGEEIDIHGSLEHDSIMLKENDIEEEFSNDQISAKIIVGGVEFNVEDITAEHMSRMTQQEQERYTYLLNELYKHSL